MKDTICKRGHEKTPENTTKWGQCRACVRQWRQDNPSKVIRSQGASARRIRMKNLYNLTEEEYQEMYARQRGLCVLPSCSSPATDIDHCHVLHKTRGLMCNRHNLALGLFSDNPTLLREAAEYLETFYG